MEATQEVIRKNLKSSNPKGSLPQAGGRGVWGEFRPPYKFWAKSVRIFSNAHRLYSSLPAIISVHYWGGARVADWDRLLSDCRGFKSSTEGSNPSLPAEK